MMASQMYANREVQAQSSASGYAPIQGMDPTQALGAMAQQLMSTMDTNKSGYLDKAEFSQAAQALAKSSGKTDISGVDAAFGKIDSNGDGEISSDEFMSAIKQATAQHDTQKPHHHHHSDASASNSYAPQSEQSSAPTQEASQMSAMQKNLFNKIMAAYGTSTPTLGTTSNPTA
jgi:hypothetical protein